MKNIQKRKIVALACAAGIAGLAGMSGAAHAQTSVVLYGLIDVNMSNLKYGDKRGGISTWNMYDGTVNGVYGSRWGMRATEDLGGGLKVQTVLESGFGVDSGASFQGGRLFGRQAYVSLSSADLGEVRFGRQYVPADGINGGISAPLNGLAMNPSLPVNTTSGSLSQWVTPGRLDNIAQYLSPKFGPVDFALLMAPGEGVNDRYQAVRVNFTGESLVAAAAYESNKDRITGNSTNKLTSTAASYNFGPFKLTGGFQRADALTLNTGNAGGFTNLTVPGPITFVARKIETRSIGVAVPVNPALTLGANYYKSKYSSATNASLSLGKLGLGARYKLSKRTELYSSMTIANSDLKEYIQEKRVIQFGMNTIF